jgi:hypothetical protein
VTYLRIIAWDVLGRIARRLLIVAALFFFASWVGMVFWGMVAAEIGSRTASYFATSLGLVGLWLVILPVIVVALRIYTPPEKDLFA